MEDNSKRQSMIKVRGGYSDKNGCNVVCNSLQIDELDDRTRVILSNELYKLCGYIFKNEMDRYESNYRLRSNQFCEQLISEVFNKSTAKTDCRTVYIWENIFKDIEEVIKNVIINEVLDIIWFFCNWVTNNLQKNFASAVQDCINYVFERECVGYRLIDGEIVRITDEEEIKTINKTCNCKHNSCKIHIKKALGFLSDRNNPDYKNSIKESISAVESVCQIITNDGKATLGEAIKHIEEKGIKLHKALKNAFSALYGYTSNECGIRHAEGMFESNVTFDEAKYMLVSCCAFVNYLIGQYSKIK